MCSSKIRTRHVGSFPLCRRRSRNSRQRRKTGNYHIGNVRNGDESGYTTIIQSTLFFYFQRNWFINFCPLLDAMTSTWVEIPSQISPITFNSEIAEDYKDGLKTIDELFNRAVPSLLLYVPILYSSPRPRCCVLLDFFSRFCFRLTMNKKPTWKIFFSHWPTHDFVNPSIRCSTLGEA